MRATDTVSFPDYEYCAINESCKHRKDAKLQFVALIVSKPEIGPDQRLMWRVVDRTGEVHHSPLSRFSSYNQDCRR